MHSRSAVAIVPFTAATMPPMSSAVVALSPVASMIVASQHRVRQRVVRTHGNRRDVQPANRTVTATVTTLTLVADTVVVGVQVPVVFADERTQVAGIEAVPRGAVADRPSQGGHASSSVQKRPTDRRADALGGVVDCRCSRDRADTRSPIFASWQPGWGSPSGMSTGKAQSSPGVPTRRPPQVADRRVLGAVGIEDVDWSGSPARAVADVSRDAPEATSSQGTPGSEGSPDHGIRARGGTCHYALAVLGSGPEVSTGSAGALVVPRADPSCCPLSPEPPARSGCPVRRRRSSRDRCDGSRRVNARAQDPDRDTRRAGCCGQRGQMTPSELWQQRQRVAPLLAVNPAKQTFSPGQSASEVQTVASSVQIPMPSHSISVRHRPGHAASSSAVQRRPSRSRCPCTRRRRSGRAFRIQRALVAAHAAGSQKLAMTDIALVVSELANGECNKSMLPRLVTLPWRAGSRSRCRSPGSRPGSAWSRRRRSHSVREGEPDPGGVRSSPDHRPSRALFPGVPRYASRARGGRGLRILDPWIVSEAVLCVGAVRTSRPAVNELSLRVGYKEQPGADSENYCDRSFHSCFPPGQVTLAQ